MPNARPLILFLLVSVSLVLAACVPQSDMERAPGGSGTSELIEDLTPIPEAELPDLPDFNLQSASVNITRGGNRVRAEIFLTAGRGSGLELAGLGEVEWSDGEVSDAVPLEGEELGIETRRTDASGEAVPVSLYLTGISRLVGTDENAEITEDAIITEWGTFPVRSIEFVSSLSRLPSYDLEFQAAGQRWVSRVAVRHDEGRLAEATASLGPFADGYRPQLGTLQFGPEVENLEALLPTQATVDVREAIPEAQLNL